MKKQMSIDEFRTKVETDSKNVKEAIQFLSKVNKQVKDFKKKQKVDKALELARIDVYGAITDVLQNEIYDIKSNINSADICKFYERICETLKDYKPKVERVNYEHGLQAEYAIIVKLENKKYFITTDGYGDKSQFKYFFYTNQLSEPIKCTCSCPSCKSVAANIAKSRLTRIQADEVLKLFPETVFVVDKLGSNS